MRRKLSNFGLAALLIGGAAIGCNRQVVREKEKYDPLLMTKKPVEGKTTGESRQTARDDVPAPPLPTPPFTTVNGPSESSGLIHPARLMGIRPIGDAEHP